MYVTSSKKAQSARDRGKYVDWVNGDETLTNEQKRDNLKSHLAWLHSELVLAKEQKNYKRRREVGQEIRKTCEAMNAIRPTKKGPEMPFYFMEAAREVLPAMKFKEIKRRAGRMMDSKGA